MGIKLPTQDQKSQPTVRLQDQVNSTFTGDYLASKPVTMNGKANFVHQFAVVDGDAPITIKENDAYVSKDVQVGDLVNIFGGHAVNTALSAAKIGQRIKFTFLGKKKLKGGRSLNEYDIEVVS